MSGGIPKGVPPKKPPVCKAGKEYQKPEHFSLDKGGVKAGIQYIAQSLAARCYEGVNLDGVSIKITASDFSEGKGPSKTLGRTARKVEVKITGISDKEARDQVAKLAGKLFASKCRFDGSGEKSVSGEFKIVYEEE